MNITKQIAEDLTDFLLLSGEKKIDIDQGDSIVFVAECMLPDTVIIISPYGAGVYHCCIIDRESGSANVSAYVYNAIGIIAELVKYSKVLNKNDGCIGAGAKLVVKQAT